jgi:hypothetical protein
MVEACQSRLSLVPFLGWCFGCADKIPETDWKDTAGGQAGGRRQLQLRRLEALQGKPALPTERLLFEEIFESLARVERTRGRRFRHGGLLRGLRISGGCGVFFDGHAKFVKGAGVLRVFGGDALGDGLRAFELRAGVEEAALLAAVKLETALGALAVGIETGSEDGAAVRTAGAGDRADHAGSARAEVIIGSRTAGGRLFFMRTLFFVLLFAIAIAAMAILTVHVRLRLTVRAGGNC